MHDGEYKPMRGIEKLKDYIIENVIKHDRCLVMGSSDMMDQFTKDCKVPIDVVMADLVDFDGKIVAEPMRIFNKASKEIFLLGMASKTKIINVMIRGTIKDVDKAKDLVMVELKKEKCKSGYIFTADSSCANTQEEKIAMISSLFRRPDMETISEMETSKKLMKGEFILEVDRSARNQDIVLEIPMEDQDDLTTESFCEVLGIDNGRDKELIDLAIKFFGRAVGVEKLSNANDISNMNHDIFLSLLEKDKGTSNIEKLYVAFNQGMVLQEFASEFGDKFEYIENDTNARIIQIGKRYACELRKSDTIIKIEHLDNLSLREKLKACFWSGYYNQEFYNSSEQ